MEIGILTLHLANNYGGVLQNYALRKFLETQGHNVVTIDNGYKIRPFKLRNILSIFKRTIQKLLGNTNINFVNPQKEVEFRNTPSKNHKLFIEKYIKTINIKDKITTDIQSENNFDAIVVGSDQVWRPNFLPNVTNYYLDFITDTKIKKITYAASFGVDNWEYSADLTIKIKKLIAQFDAVSVREKSGVDLCKKYLNVDAECLVDPTMLLNKDDYKKLISNTATEPPNGDLLVYVLDWTKEKKAIVNYVAERKKLRSFVVGQPHKKEYPSIESWLNGFENAKFVITDSFHGTVFAILYNIPFISLVNEGRGATRFTSLLDMFQLSSKLLNKCDYSEIDKILNDEIKYDEVNKILDFQRNKSKIFLNKIQK